MNDNQYTGTGLAQIESVEGIDATDKERTKRILANFRVSIPAEVEKDLLDRYGNLDTDQEGHLRGYTEQDICEGLRKRLYQYQSSQKQVRDDSVIGVG